MHQQLLAAYGGGGGGGLTTASLLHFEGTNGSTTFTDDIGKTWTPSGNAQISTARSRAGSASGLFDGAGDYIDCTGGSDFAFGTGDFCINLSVYFASLAATAFLLDNRFGSYGSDLAIYFDASQPGIWVFLNGANRILIPSISTGTWYDLEVSRTSGTTRAFQNGTAAVDTYADSSNYATSQFRMASRFNGANYLNGNIDEFRVIKGGGGHTANYTPSFPLT